MADNPNPNMTEQQKADLSKRRGQAAATIGDPEERRKYVAKQGETEAKNKGQLDPVSYNNMSTDAALKGYKDGTDYVSKTGPAVLHKGEAVLKKEDADKLRAAKGKMKSHLEHVAASLSDHDADDKPAKELDHIRTRKVKNSKGGHSYIHEHHYTHPEHYKPEEHVSSDQDGMVDHMMTHMGEPNPGEAEADAGQSGIPAGIPGME